MFQIQLKQRYRRTLSFVTISRCRTTQHAHTKINGFLKDLSVLNCKSRSPKKEKEKKKGHTFPIFTFHVHKGRQPGQSRCSSEEYQLGESEFQRQ